jgi:hypothetical protein
VVTTAKDYETGAETVIFYYVTYTQTYEYVTMTLADFNQMVTYNGKRRRLFVRQPQMKIRDCIWRELEMEGFEGVHRVHKSKPRVDEYDERKYRTENTYYDYAKDLCKHYVVDRKKYLLCKKQNCYVGITKEAYGVMMEDQHFMNNCFKTVLVEYREYFRERYVEGLSVRKYADKHGLNRGSVEHIERKMIDAFATELKQRDDADGIIRLNQK